MQNVLSEHQALCTHQSAVVADLSVGQTLEGRAIVEVKGLCANSSRHRACLNGRLQVEQCRTAIIQYFVCRRAGDAINDVVLCIITLCIGRQCMSYEVRLT